jgi:hypothetical protein
MPASLFQPRIYAALSSQPLSFHRHEARRIAETKERMK